MITKFLFILAISFFMQSNSLYAYSSANWNDYKKRIDEAKNKKDYKRAREIMIEGARKGIVESQYTLAITYSGAWFASNYTKDHAEMRRWLIKVVDYDLKTKNSIFIKNYKIDPKLLLANLYRKGLGGDKDLVSAHVLYNFVAVSGKRSAETSRNKLEKKMTSRQISLAIQKAVPLFPKALKRGGKAGKFILAQMYENGKGVPGNKKEAFHLYLHLAEHDHVYAMNSVGRMYLSGLGVARDIEKARLWYGKSAEKGNKHGKINLAYLSEDIDFSKSKEEILNDGLIQINKKNYKKAFSIFNKFANEGSARAQNYLGSMFSRGYGIPKDQKDAFYWYKESANKGLAAGQRNLAVMYERGQGVSKNTKLASEWNKKAASQESATVVKNDLKRRAEQGDPKSQYLLALEYQNRHAKRKKGDVENNAARSFYWYKKSAEAGYLAAFEMLGKRYRSGYGTKKNIALANKWFDRYFEGAEKEAVKGDRWYQFTMGRLFSVDKYYGRKKDIIKAIFWYKKAGEQGDITSLNRIGMHYLDGKEAKRNLYKALPYFKKSADLGDKVGANNYKYVSDQIRMRKQWKEGEQNELSVSISLNPNAPRLIIFQSLGCIHCARFVKKHLYWLKEAVAAEKLSLRIVDIHWGFSDYLGKASRYLSCISEEKSNREYLSALFSFSNYIVTKTDGKTPDPEKLSDKITRRVLDGAFKRIRKKYQGVSEACLNKDGSEKTKKLNEAVKKLKIKKVPAYHFAGQLYSRDQFPILKKRIMEAM